MDANKVLEPTAMNADPSEAKAPGIAADTEAPAVKYKYLLTPSELANIVSRSTAAISKSFKEKATIAINGKRVGIPPKMVRAYLEAEGADFTPRVIAHLNLRGGIAKTTASLHLATRAHQLGHNVCLMDLDSQASATVGLGIRVDDARPVFVDVFENLDLIAEAIIEIEPGLSVLPSSLNNALLDSVIGPRPTAIRDGVAKVCDRLKEMGFTLIVIDCSPSLSSSVTSTMCAADQVVIPVNSDIFSIRGLEMTLDEVNKVCDAFKIDPPDTRILFSKYDTREKLLRLSPT